MDMQHHIYLMILGGEIYRAPISSKCDRVLDIGTGTGIWAIDFADEHPDSQVIATDLSVIQPQWVPPNLSFQVDDCEADWSYSQPFDFIHIRSMSGSISDWPRTLQQSFQNTVSGGWIELVDFEVWASTDDNSLPENSSYHEYQVRLDEAARRFGKIMNISPQFNSMVNAAGFQDVHEDIYKVPLTPWPADPKQKLLGQYMHLQMTESIEAFCLALFSRVLGWDNNRIQVLLAGVRADLRNKNMHMYSKVYVLPILLARKVLLSSNTGTLSTGESHDSRISVHFGIPAGGNLQTLIQRLAFDILTMLRICYPHCSRYLWRFSAVRVTR